MKKKIKLLSFILLIVLINVLFIKTVSASSANISVRNSASTIIVGRSITTTVTVSSNSNLGAWAFDLKYDTTRLRLTNSSFGGTYIADVFKSPNQKSATYTFTFTAIASGNANISVANSEVVGFDETKMSVVNGSSNVRIITQQEYEASLSRNNFLKNLNVEGVNFVPEFNKEILEYSVTLEPETKKINITASTEDSKASVKGTGEISVSDGENKINIVVTAENGSIRTYVINAKVEELDPINVDINGNRYTIVRQAEFVKCPSIFIEKEVLINDEAVPGCYNEITDTNLIALKDEEGTINTYIYEDEKYILYKELTFGRIILLQKDFNFTKSSMPKGYRERELKIGDTSTIVYQNINNKNYSLIYGLNIQTGEENLYLHDASENTLQRYFYEEIEEVQEKANKYLLYIVIIGCISFIFLILCIFMFIKLNKIKKRLKRI